MRKLGGVALVATCAISIACGSLVGAPSSSEGPASGEAGADAASTSSSDAGHGDASGPVDGGPVNPDAAAVTVCKTGEVYCPANGLCQTACAGCTDYPIACFACDTNQKNPIGTCEPDNGNAFCLNGDYSTAYLGGPGKHCDCSGTDVGNCPGANQVCINAGSTDFCLTCGEPSSNGLTCKASGSCNAGNRTCD